MIEKDQQYRDAKTRGDYLRGQRNTISKQEPVAARPARAVQVDPVETFHDIHMIGHLESRDSRIPKLLDLNIFYRIHQFEKQEMVVVCKPEESAEWFCNLWKNTVDFFRLGNIHRTILIEVILQKSNQHSRRCNHRIVEGMRVVVAALPVLDTDAQPACLCITQVGAAPDLEIFFLSGRPCLDIDALDLQVRPITG